MTSTYHCRNLFNKMHKFIVRANTVNIDVIIILIKGNEEPIESEFINMVDAKDAKYLYQKWLCTVSCL